MRKLFFFILIIFCFSSNSFSQKEKSISSKIVLSNKYYDTSNHSYKITIKTNNSILSSIQIPKGVYLNVEYTTEQNSEIVKDASKSDTYQGDLIIRIKNTEKVEKSEVELRLLSDIMSKSPMEIKLIDVTVIIEKCDTE